MTRPPPDRRAPVSVYRWGTEGPGVCVMSVEPGQGAETRSDVTPMEASASGSLIICYKKNNKSTLAKPSGKGAQLPRRHPAIFSSSRKKTGEDKEDMEGRVPG